MSRLGCIFLLFISSGISILAQEPEAEKNMRFVVQLDSRNTFVRDKTVGIFGIRGGFLFKDKYELGIGLYGTRLLDFLGNEVEKDYLDNSQTPAELRPALIGFEYASFYAEYEVLENARWQLTVNSQYGMGRVNIRLQETNGDESLGAQPWRQPNAQAQKVVQQSMVWRTE